MRCYCFETGNFLLAYPSITRVDLAPYIYDAIVTILQGVLVRHVPLFTNGSFHILSRFFLSAFYLLSLCSPSLSLCSALSLPFFFPQRTLRFRADPYSSLMTYMRQLNLVGLTGFINYTTTSNRRVPPDGAVRAFSYRTDEQHDLIAISVASGDAVLVKNPQVIMMRYR